MKKPNILFILIDDLGWRDLACYGSTFYETPNLDRFAGEGLRLTDAYAACPVCSSTRTPARWSIARPRIRRWPMTCTRPWLPGVTEPTPRYRNRIQAGQSGVDKEKHRSD